MKMLPRFVGTNYHPQDWTEEQWIKDLDAMKDAGFTVIRTNHICWDSVEPHEGSFTFEWLDTIMELCKERGIRILLDIPTRSAPLWLHKKFPSINVVDSSGNMLHPSTRYMVDVGDPAFRRYALRLVEAITTRYADHPALLAFCLCNELGSGFHSFSPTALARFQKWLEDKYGDIASLNLRWNTKRWSRKLEGFDDVFFPVSGETIKGAPESWLDMKRFFSDEILTYMQLMHDACKKYAPEIPVSTNHWAENPREGFDYQKVYRGAQDYPGEGFYPGINPEYEDGFIGNCQMTDFRIGEMDAPMWCLEFQTGSGGGYGSPEGAMRMYAYLAWVYRSDIICAWTWRAMLGGEEQYLFGLLDHDGYFSRKYYEFKKIAQEWALLEEKGVSRRPDTKRIGLAFSYDSYLTHQYAGSYYKTKYTDQILEAYKALFYHNIDCNVIDLRNVEKEYPIVIVPGHSMMSPECANAIRGMVEKGCTVIMTAYSAKVDEYNQGFTEPQPGYLSDVFGVAVHGFDRNITHVSAVNEGGIEKKPVIRRRNEIDVVFDQERLHIPVDYYEFLFPTTAEPIAYYFGIAGEESIAATCNSYGKGKAIYLGVPSDETLLYALIRRYDQGNDLDAFSVPSGIVTRLLKDEKRIYINTTDKTVSVPLSMPGKDILSSNVYHDVMTMAPYDVTVLTNYRK